MIHLSRRQLLHLAGLSGANLILGGCGTPILEDVIGEVSEPLNQKVGSLLLKSQQPVPEFTLNDIQPEALIVNSFRGNPLINLDKYRLVVDGEVDNPLSLSMEDIHNLAFTSTIIRHVCVEGWAAIVQWGGVKLREIVALAQPKSNVHYAYFQSADGYYSSWDIASSVHAQTLLAFEKNGAPLPVENGAPLRLVTPVKLGYKLSKWVIRITLVSHLSRFQGYWEDQGYEWFAGI
ncbi:MAG: molybdopterin-dependent oxidoreductase [Richelia sp.]|nr:molybdopterin-dependent oxidoreductase [Richelia sp.]